MKKTWWHAGRTLMFYIVGAFNTILLRPEDEGSWKFYVGLAFLLLAVIDTAWLFRQHCKSKQTTEHTS